MPAREGAGRLVASSLVMTLTKTQKSDIITEHRRYDADTGSAEVQIAVLSLRISDPSTRYSNRTPYSPTSTPGTMSRSDCA